MPFNEFVWRNRMEGSSAPSVVRLAGHRFPSDPGSSVDERITHLEDAVRSLHASMLVIAAQLERISRERTDLTGT